MRHINLKWAKSENDSLFNFGDDLGPYIINKLSGLEVKYFHFANNRLNIIKQFIHGIIHGKFSFKYFSDFFKCFFASYYIISIGSIIQWYGSSRCVVWGSGIINRKDKINSSRFLAVRGEYTKAMVKSLGFKEPEAMGDPALLLPLIYSPVVTKKYRLGIIPHKNHYDIVKNKLKHDDILIIKLDTPDLENVIDDIVSCEYTISTSLHGLIVSHAYSIKSLWFTYNDIPLPGDNVKFLDYFSSVKIPEYSPLILNLDMGIDSKAIIDLIKNNENTCQSNKEIRGIQMQLIKVAPFPIKKEFRIA